MHGVRECNPLSSAPDSSLITCLLFASRCATVTFSRHTPSIFFPTAMTMMESPHRNSIRYQLQLPVSLMLPTRKCAPSQSHRRLRSPTHRGNRFSRQCFPKCLPSRNRRRLSCVQRCNPKLNRRACCPFPLSSEFSRQAQSVWVMAVVTRPSLFSTIFQVLDPSGVIDTVLPK